MKRSSRLSLALHALVHLHKQPGEAITSTTLAQCLMTNPVVVRRVLGELREAGLVISTKGHDGGWRLLRPAGEISLRQVYAAMGESLLIRTESDPGDIQCGIVRTVNSVMGDFLADAEALLAARLERVSLDDIARQAQPNPLHPIPESISMDDVIIIGGSFAGLAGALQLGRARRKVTVLDTGLPRNRFAGHSHGLLGHDHKPPLDILAEARQQLARYPTVRLVNARADAITGAADDFSVLTDDGESLRARRLLLSYGVADQMPDIPGFAACWGKSIVPCPYCDGFEVAGRHWGLVWSGPQSAHAVSLFHDWTDRLTLFADGHDIPPETRADLARRNVPVIDGRISEIAHSDGRLSTINLDTGAKVEVDVLFAHPRNRPSANLHEALGLETVDTPVGIALKVDDRRETSMPGIYAAGDLANPMASVTLASSHGAMAAIFAQQSMLV